MKNHQFNIDSIAFFFSWLSSRKGLFVNKTLCLCFIKVTVIVVLNSNKQFGIVSFELFNDK